MKSLKTNPKRKNLPFSSIETGKSQIHSSKCSVSETDGIVSNVLENMASEKSYNIFMSKEKFKEIFVYNNDLVLDDT